MRLNQIHDFIAVVHNGSLRAAAHERGVSQPAMTKSIQQLETELQVQLLERSTRGVAPTRTGRAFLLRARAVQAELRKAEDDLEALRGGSEGSVALGATPVSCMVVVPEAMLAFRRRFARARVRIVEGGNAMLLPMVRDETLDFSMGQQPGAKADPGLRFKPLFRPRLAITARAGHPLAAAKALGELVGATWLMFNAPGSRGMLEETFAGAGLPAPANIVHCESFATALGLLSGTDTLGLIAPQLLVTPFTAKALISIEVKEEVIAPLVGMYSRSNSPLSPAAAAMAQAVTEVTRRIARDQ